MYNNRNNNNTGAQSRVESLEMTNTSIHSPIGQTFSNDILFTRPAQPFQTNTQRFSISSPINDQKTSGSFTMPSFGTSHLSLPQSQLETIYHIEQSQRHIHGSSSFENWSRHYPSNNGRRSEVIFTYKSSQQVDLLYKLQNTTSYILTFILVFLVYTTIFVFFFSIDS